MQNPTHLFEALSLIARVDRLVDRNRDNLIRLEGVRPRTAGGWQRLYDRHPHTQAREHRLFALRGQFQKVRDEAEWKASRAVEREVKRAAYKKASRCPTCGSYAVSA